MKLFPNYFTVLFILLSVLSCQKEEEPGYTLDKLTGYVQKGPYINGTAITVSELNSNLNSTGKVFSSQIFDNKGSFEINEVTLNSKYVEIRADGFYFDEVKGEKSSAQLTLFGLADISNKSSINVNILTQIEKGRVEHLISTGLTFDEAKDQAQAEVLAALGMELDGMSSSELLDISKEDEENAILLAISLIFQGSRSVGDLTELIANFNTDLREDGILDSEILRSDLRQNAKGLVLGVIRTNLENRYQELGVDASISDFETYINAFLDYSAEGPLCRVGEVTNITASSATLNGFVIPNNAPTMVSFEYDMNEEYSYSVNVLESPVDGSEEVEVSANIPDLTEGAEYYFRIKAENEFGIVYSAENSFVTSYDGVDGSVSDIDGNTYKTTGIGKQLWMAENLATTKYNDGISIPNETDSLWLKLETPAYCWYENDSATNKQPYGALYNWYAVETEKICPSGWHVPSRGEWNTLFDYLGGTAEADDKMIETSNGEWIIPLPNANNESGFSALPAGQRNYVRDEFIGMGELTSWWTTDEYENSQNEWLRIRASIVTLEPAGNYYVVNIEHPKNGGLSIRCIKD